METQKLVEALTLMVLWYPPAAEDSQNQSRDGGEVPGCFQVWTWVVGGGEGGSGIYGGSRVLWDSPLSLFWVSSSPDGPEAKGPGGPQNKT